MIVRFLQFKPKPAVSLFPAPLSTASSLSVTSKDYPVSLPCNCRRHYFGGSHTVKYADLELTTRGEFPHGLAHPQWIKRSDKNIPWYFSTMKHVYHWPVLGDNWDDQGGMDGPGTKAAGKAHDLHMFYTLAWWKLGEGIVDDQEP